MSSHTYQEQLRRRCDTFAFEFRRNERGDYTDDLFFEFVREIAFEFFKKGKAAASRERKSAQVPQKGGALENEKLVRKA